MATLKEVKLALRFAIRKSEQSFLPGGEDWETFDRVVFLLLGVVQDFGYSKEQTISLYEEAKKEVGEELKGA